MSTQIEECPDEDLEFIFITVVSETLGRRTYTTRVVQRCIQKRMSRLSDAALSCLGDVLSDAEDGGVIDAEDVDGWLQLRKEIRAELQKRKDCER